MPDAFTLQHKGKVIEYRAPDKELDETELRSFFAEKGYALRSFTQQARHGICQLEKSNQLFFAKVARSEGISILTAQEISWDEQVSAALPPDTVFTVPTLIEHGFFQEKYVYFIAEWQDIHLIAQLPPAHQQLTPLSLSEDVISTIVRMTLQIQILPITLHSPDESLSGMSHSEALVEKTQRWKEKITTEKKSSPIVSQLFSLVSTQASTLPRVVRQGDCAPWHMSLSTAGRIYLFDGEHATSTGVAGYDIAYCIQRVFSVLLSPDLAKTLYAEALCQEYDAAQLRVVLAARAIGGYCDESLLPVQDFTIHDAFAHWVLSL